MAEKLFTNVRLGLKIDTLENWGKSSLVLKKGEVAFATVAASAGVGLTEPVVMMKIGDGEHTFSELKFDFYAKASDVLEAAKDADKLTAFINGVITNAKLASSADLTTLAGRVTTAEGDIDKLEAALDAEGGLKARMTAVEAKAALVGDEAVATQIQNAINGLNIAEYAKKTEVEAVDTALSTYKTSNDAAVKKISDDLAAEISRAGLAEKANADAIALIKDSETIDSFADVVTELGKKEAAGAAAQALVDAKAYADGLAKDYDAAGSAAAALEDAKEYADGLAGDYDAAGSAAQTLVDAKAYVDAQIDEWVGAEDTVAEQISTAIAAEKLAETYAAKVHKHVKADITDFAHTHEMAEVNGLAAEFEKYQLAGDYATKAEAKGYADAKDDAIAAALAAGQEADRKAVAAQGEVDALELVVGALPEGETSVVAYIQKKTEGIATNAALGELQGAVDALEEQVGEGKVAENIAAAVEAEAKIARAAEKANADAIKAIKDDYLVEADKTALQGQITANANAIELLTNGVKAEEVDGVNDLIQYVKDHGTEVTGIKKDISDNAAAIEAEAKRAAGVEGGLDERLQAVETAVGESGSVAGDIADAVTEAKGYTDTEVNKLVNGSIKTNTEAIAALQGKVGDKDVHTQITEAITAENLDQYATDTDLEDAIDRIEALEAVDHEHANKAELDKFAEGDKAKLDAAVQTVTAGVGLKAVKTGTDVAIDLDETVTFIFDCGDSGVNA